LLLGTTGLRLGEALGLHWDDIDWDREEIRVRRSAKRVKGQGIIEEPPKTKHGVRNVDITPSLVRALRGEQDKQKLARVETPLVFPTATGKHLDQTRIHLHFRADRAKAGVPRYRIHDLRHTVVSHLLMAGVPDFEVTRKVGHSSSSFTKDRYGKFIPNDQRNVSNTMDAVLRGARSRQPG
jgi:integrase